MSQVSASDLRFLRIGETFPDIQHMDIGEDLRRFIVNSRKVDWYPEKHYARTLFKNEVVRSLGIRGATLRCLTLPGPFWVWERMIERELRTRRRLSFIGVERSKKLFAAGCALMPRSCKGLKVRGSSEAGGHTVSNGSNCLLIHGDIHDVIQHQQPPSQSYDVVWIDSNSPITAKLLQSMHALRLTGKMRTPSVFGVSVQVGRESLDVTRLIDVAGGRSELLRRHVSDAFVATTELHVHRYQRKVPMLQMCWLLP